MLVGPLRAEVTVPGDVLGWTPGGVHRRGPVGIGKPGAEALGSFARWDFPLPPRGMSRSTSGGPCPPRYPPRACGEVEWAIFDASGGWWGLLRAGAVGVVTFLDTNF